MKRRSRGPGLKEHELLERSNRLLVDTCALIYFLGGAEPYLSSVLVPLFERVRAGEATIVVSVITEAELLVRPFRLGDMRAVERIRDLLSEDGIDVVDVDRVIARRAAELRVENHLALADSLIVATGIESHCAAIVGNDMAWAKRPLAVPYVLLDRASGRQETRAGGPARAEA